MAKPKFELMTEVEHQRLIKIFDILKKNAVQTKQFKAPVILYMHFEKLAKQINKEIRQ